LNDAEPRLPREDLTGLSWCEGDLSPALVSLNPVAPRNTAHQEEQISLCPRLLLIRSTIASSTLRLGCQGKAEGMRG
jgi:hypothetical protein